MKNLLFLLLVIFVIASCDNYSTDPGGFEPHRVGTWFIQTPDSANWIGSASKAKNDTTYIESPQGHHISIRRSSVSEGATVFKYIDSTIVDSPHNFDLSETSILAPNTGLSSDAERISVGVNRILVELTYFWDCGTSVSGNQVLYVQFYLKKGQPAKRYVFRVDGIDDVMNQVAC